MNQRFVICALVGAIGIAFYVKPLLTRFAVLDDYKKLIEVRSGIQLFGIDRGMAGTLWQTGETASRDSVWCGLVGRNRYLKAVNFTSTGVLCIDGFSAALDSLRNTI